MAQVRTGKARPFLKWAGGKRQLLPQIDGLLPAALKNGRVKRYVEPFVGSGALFFHIAQTYPIEEFFISDINPELILAYRTIQKNVRALIVTLSEIEEEYLRLGESDRQRFFYNRRADYNSARSQINYDEYDESWVGRTAQMLFINKTCYNGLFRVNSRGEYNVPFGRYTRPAICDQANLEVVSAILQRTRIRSGHYTGCAGIIDDRTLVYFDPPYRPLSTTANFTAYSPHSFDDNSQLELADFYRRLDKRGAYLLLSNSDPRSADPKDDFLESAYQEFQIKRVQARRRINSNAQKRGRISELLIHNYTVQQPDRE